MVGIQSISRRLEFVVVLQPRYLTVELRHIVLSLSEIDIAILDIRRSDVSTHQHGIPRHAQPDLCAFQLQIGHSDAPVVLRLSCIRRHGIRETYFQLCTVEYSLVHIGERLLQVNSVAFQVHLFHISLHPQVGNETVGIQPELFKPQGIDLHLFVKQRFELDVGVYFSQIGNGITQSRDGIIVLDDLHVIHCKIKREPERDMTDRDVHPCLLRSICCHLVHRPVLHRRQVKEEGEQEEEQYGSDQQDGQPFQRLFHSLMPGEASGLELIEATRSCQRLSSGTGASAMTVR